MPPEGIARIADTLQKRTYKPKEAPLSSERALTVSHPTEGSGCFVVLRTSSASMKRARSSSSCSRAWPEFLEIRFGSRFRLLSAARSMAQARVWVRTGNDEQEYKRYKAGDLFGEPGAKLEEGVRLVRLGNIFESL